MLSCSNYAHLLLQRHMEALEKVYMLGKQELLHNFLSSLVVLYTVFPPALILSCYFQRKLEMY
ncbi:hypothetical protein ACJX0J_013054, partial [Zea mays]